MRTMTLRVFGVAMLLLPIPAGPVSALIQGEWHEPPGTVTYQAVRGEVAFAHDDHAFRIDCTTCHATQPPKPITLDMQKADELCKACHQQIGVGPTECGECHRQPACEIQ